MGEYRPFLLFFNSPFVFYPLMGEGFMGGLRTFLNSDFVLKDTKKIFCKCYQIISGSLVEICYFSGEWKVVSVAPQRGGGVHPPQKNLEVFFTHILASATRLNTSYGLETLQAQLSRHVGITQKVLRHIRHF